MRSGNATGENVGEYPNFEEEHYQKSVKFKKKDPIFFEHT